MSPIRYTLACAAAIGLLLVPAAAEAASYRDVIADCAQDGQLDRRYSRPELKKAEDRLPSDLDEYSDCREVIAGALPGGSGRGPAAGDGGLVSPQEAAARQEDQTVLSSLTGRQGTPRVAVGGRTVEPGGNGLFKTASAANGMPLPLLLAVIAIGLLATGAAGYVLRRRIPGLSSLSLPRPLLSRVPLPRPRR